MIVERVLRFVGKRSSTTASRPASWFVDWVHGGETSAAGIRISRETALTYSPWWRAVNIVAGDCAKVPLHCYRRVGSGKERDTNHPAYKLLRRRPNKYMTAYTLKEVITAHAIQDGNGYAYIDRDPLGVPISLSPLVPAETTPVIEIDTQTGAERYLYTTIVNGHVVPIPPDKVFHLKNLSPNGMVGYSVVGKAKDSLGLGLGAHKYATVFFKNNGRPGVVLKFPNRLDDRGVKLITESWERAHSGLDNAHRAAILEQGGDIATIGGNNEHAQTAELMALSIREVSNWTGVPPHKLGDTTRTAYASIEQENKAYLQDCLDRWFTAWEEEAYDKLLSDREKEADSHLFEFMRAKLVSTDTKTEHEVLVSAVLNGLRTVDEARATLNLPAYPDGIGSVPYFPLNMAKLGEDPPDPQPTGEPPADEPPPEDEEEDEDTPEADEAARQVVAETARRLVKKIGHEARSAARTPDKFFDWLDTLHDRYRAMLNDAFRPIVVAGRIARGFDAEKRAADTAFAVVDWIRGELLELSGKCRAADLACRVDDLAGRFEEHAAAKVALTIFGADHA